MEERTRRRLFLFLFAVALFETGAHASQAFITNWPRLVPEWIRAGLYLWMASLLVSIEPAGNEQRP